MAPTCFSPTDRLVACSQVAAHLINAASATGLLSKADAQQELTTLATTELNVREYTTLPEQILDLQGLGLWQRDFNDNALLLCIGQLTRQLDNLVAKVTTALQELARLHPRTLIACTDVHDEPRVTSLGCLAYEWQVHFTALIAQQQQLSRTTMVVRYSIETLARRRKQAGQLSKLLAVGLGLGHASGLRVQSNFAADWAVWLYKVICVSATAIATLRQLGQDAKEVREINTALNQVVTTEGSKVIGELLLPTTAGDKREWVYLEQLRELCVGGLTWVHELATREYDAAALCNQTHGEHRSGLGPAAINVLTEKFGHDHARGKVMKATREAEENNEDLLDILIRKNPDLKEELLFLGTPEAALGLLPKWLTTLKHDAE